MKSLAELGNLGVSSIGYQIRQDWVVCFPSKASRKIEKGEIMGLPWASGPGELLRHGLVLLRTDREADRRIAMISIDNSVELMIKTFLGLPQRTTGLKIARKEYHDFSESFPRLLDAIEKYAPEKVAGINLGEIEWYHRLRNELYHQGNGLTVERDKINIYAELANLLFENLFGERLVESREFSSELLGDFMSAWSELERVTQPYLLGRGKTSRVYVNIPGVLHKQGILSSEQMDSYDRNRNLRNEIVHGKLKAEEAITVKVISEVEEIVSTIDENNRKKREQERN